MNTEKVLAEFKSICKDVFEEEDLDFELETLIEDIDEWDSLNHIHLVVAVEKHFNIQFNTSDLQGVLSIGDFVSMVERYSQEASS